MADRQKCPKCDERGYINDGRGFSHSCECGWAIEQMNKRFRSVSIEDLFAYVGRRIEDKRQIRSLVAGLLGSIKSEKKSISSQKNGKLGGRPKKTNNNQADQ